MLQCGIRNLNPRLVLRRQASRCLSVGSIGELEWSIVERETVVDLLGGYHVPALCKSKTALNDNLKDVPRLPFIDIIELVARRTHLPLVSGGKAALMEICKQADITCNNSQDKKCIAFGAAAYFSLIGDYYKAANFLERYSFEATDVLALKLCQENYVFAGDKDRILSCATSRWLNFDAKYDLNREMTAYLSAAAHGLIENGQISMARPISDTAFDVSRYRDMLALQSLLGCDHLFGIQGGVSANILAFKDKVEKIGGREALNFLEIHLAINSMKVGNYPRSLNMIDQYMQSFGEKSDEIMLDDLVRVSIALWEVCLHLSYDKAGFRWVSEEFLDRWKTAVEEYAEFMTPFQLTVAYMSLSMAERCSSINYDRIFKMYQDSALSGKKPVAYERRNTIDGKIKNFLSSLVRKKTFPIYTARSSASPSEIKALLVERLFQRGSSSSSSSSSSNSSCAEASLFSSCYAMDSKIKSMNEYECGSLSYRDMFLQRYARDFFDAIDTFCQDKEAEAAQKWARLVPAIERVGTMPIFRSIFEATVIES